MKKKLIEKIYNEGKIVVPLTSVFELNEKHSEEMGGFHCEEVWMIEETDEYFCGIRANHFVVEIGWSEFHDGIFLLMSANHKGIRVTQLFGM